MSLFGTLNSICCEIPVHIREIYTHTKRTESLYSFNFAHKAENLDILNEETSG